MTAAAAGLPQVVVPLFASDQFANGERIAAVGAGICIDGGLDGLAEVSTALAHVLDDVAYRTAAEQVAADIGALPDVTAAVPLLERRARARGFSPRL
jgi:UDP:flavonoid glycosyltransferase YjiC (YdhE family)